MRTVTRLASHLLRIAAVDPAHDWVVSSSTNERRPHQTIEYHTMVDCAEVVTHIVHSLEAKKIHPPSQPTSVRVTDVRDDGAVSHDELFLPPEHVTTRDARYRHQDDALRASLGRRDDGVHAYSGNWIMPCGAGKTRAAARFSMVVGGRTMVLVPNASVAIQWERTYRLLGVTSVYILHHDASSTDYDGDKDRWTRLRLCEDPPAIVILTYQTLSLFARRDPTTIDVDAHLKAFLVIRLYEYGMLILDEVQMFPARSYECAVLSSLRCRVRLGVTASMRRTDGRESHILSLVGPVLYELSVDVAHAQGVTTQSTQTLYEIAMPPALLAEYAHQRRGSLKQRLCTILNPYKIELLRDLLADVARHTKVFVYCDKVAALASVADIVADAARASDGQRVFCGTFTGKTSTDERAAFVRDMRAHPCCVGLLSRAGSASIDVPDLDTIIEVDVDDTSLQKHVQRVGRSQRSHECKQTARVYTLASAGTHEVDFAAAHTFTSTVPYHGTCTPDATEVARVRHTIDRIVEVHDGGSSSSEVDGQHPLTSTKRPRNPYAKLASRMRRVAGNL